MRFHWKRLGRLAAVLLALGLLFGYCSPALAAEGVDGSAPLTEPTQPPEEDLSYEKFLEIYNLYKDNYYIAQDPEQALLNAFRQMLEYDPALFELVTNALLQGGDRYSQYIPPEVVEERDNAKVFGGIGIVTGNLDGRLVVEEFSSMGCVAQLAGMEIGDQITAIDGTSVLGLSQESIAGIARGDIGTRVTYSVYRASSGELLEFTMVRERMLTQTVLYEFVPFQTPTGQQETYALCRINDFSGLATYMEFIDFKNLCLEQNVRRMVFDLRANPGGDLTVALELINWLIPEAGKRIVTVVPRDETQTEVFETTGRGLETDKIILLVDEYTASAAELFAIALQDHKLATVVGKQTFGKAVGQSVYDLEDGSRTHITTIQVASPNGTRYNGVGVIPDVVVENTEIPRPLPGFVPFHHDNYTQAVLDADNAVVEALEQRLMVLGLMTYADSKFGSETAQALRLFQRSVGLEETGALDLATFQAMTDLVNSVKTAKYYHDDQFDKALELVTAE